MGDHETERAGPAAEDRFVHQMKKRRALLGLTQGDLAERIANLGTPMYQQTVAKIEASTRAVRLGEAEVIALALETTLPQMLLEAISQAAELGKIYTWEELEEQLAVVEREAARVSDQAQRARSELRIIEQEVAMANARLASLTAIHRQVEAKYEQLSYEAASLRTMLSSHGKETRFRKRRRRPGYYAVREADDSEEKNE